MVVYQDSGGNSVRWILENNMDIENMSYHGNQLPPAGSSLPKSASKRSFRWGGSMRKRSGNQQGTVASRLVPRMGRMQSGAVRGLNSLRFLDRNTTVKEADAWKTIERRFNEHGVNGRLWYYSSTVPMQGMAESKQFAGELFNALARRRSVKTEDGICKEELKQFWKDMTTHDLDARLQIFFDMCVRNGDGRLSEDEVKEAREVRPDKNLEDPQAARKFQYCMQVLREAYVFLKHNVHYDDTQT